MKKQIISEEFKRMQKLAGVLNENESPIEKAFNASPDELPWNTIEQAFKESGLSGEEFFAGVEDEFREKFEGKPVNKKEYFEFFTNLPTNFGNDDLYTMVNWIDFTDKDLSGKLYNTI
jgi:hypothetical protein